MNKTNAKFFAICLAATMATSVTNFTTRVLATETTKPTVQSISNKQTTNVPSVNRLLRVNSKGSDVKLVQATLNNKGYKLTVDGIFGKLTLSAVKNYQSKNSLSVDGIVGPATCSKLFPKTVKPVVITRLLRFGCVGSDVKLLQTSLNKFGYKLISDNFFGKLTLAAVRDFQSKNGLVVDGLVGPATLAKLKVKPVVVVSVKHISMDNKTDLQVGTGATKTTEQLLATISPSNATNKKVTWTSSDTKVATVNSTGLVTAVKAGTATITVTSEDGHKKATSKITVKDVTAAVVSVTGVTIDKTTVSDLQVGTGATKTTQQLSATIVPSNATNKNVTWASSDESVATVSATGLVTAVKAGSATITATSQDGAKTATSQTTVSAFVSGNSDQIDSLWTQKWNDEFSGVNGTTTDASKWVFDIGKGPNGDGWGNQELETYTDSTENVYQKDGNLVIAAKKDASGNVTSGRIKTKGSLDMKYGRVDVKAKLPTGAGFWPAIWMLPSDNVYGIWASSGEIDIMENKGRLPNEVYGTLHYGAAWPNNRYTGKAYNFPSGTDVTSFHTYSMEWEPGEIRWYVDGHLYQTQNNWSATDTNGEKISFPAPFDQNFHLILNLAYGGTFDGSIGDKANIPGEMVVDYVRAYDLTGRPYKTAVEPIVNAEVLPTGAKKADSTGNLLSNGDFSLPIKENPTGLLPLAYDWNFVHSTDIGTGTQSIEAIGGKNYAKINVTNAGAKNYSVQLMQETTLGKGRWYKLSFDAKTDTSRELGVKIGGGPTRGFASYAAALNLDLTDQFQSFETTFQMTEDTDLIARIEYELGLSTNPVWIGNTRLEEISAPIQNADASKTPLSDGNRIYNGTFDKGSIDRMTYWNFNVAGAAATASVSEATRELLVNVSDGGTDTSAITLNQKGIQLKQTSVYELKFKAKAEAPKTIKVGVLSKDGSISYNEEQTINLTTAMEEKTFSFTMDDATDLESQIAFKLGGDNNDVYIDDVSLIPTYEFIDYSLIDCYPLKNGDFSRGLESWSPYPNIGDGGASTITSVNGEAKISVTAVGPNPYSVMLNQEKFKVTKGIDYLVAFDVRSTADRNITAVIDNADYALSLSKTVAAKAGMTHYEYTVKMAKDDIVSLKFLLGNVDVNVPTSAHDIFIDNVVCEVKNAPFKKSPTLVQSVTNNKLTQPIDVTFTDDAAWRSAITSVKINNTVVEASKYTVTAGKITFAAENFVAAGNYDIAVVADGYANANAIQIIKANNNLIINNGTFDTDTTGWQNYIADGSDAGVTSVSGEMKVDFPNYAGWQKWSTQIFQDTIQLEAGKTYELKFDASSTVAREAWLEMTNLENKTLALTPTNKTFTYEFTAGATITNGKLNFLLGTNNVNGALFTKNQSVKLDNVLITEKITTPTVTTVAAVAAGITSVIAPTGTATSLTLPVVPAGYTIAIKSSNNEGVIATNGIITAPVVATTVAVVFTVTKTADGTTADTTIINVTVPAPGVTPPPTGTTAVVTFDDSAISYSLIGFGGTDGTIVADTVDASNKVAKVVKAGGAETWAGTTFGQAEGDKSTITAVPFDATNQKMSVKVWSPDAGIKVRLKLEDKAAKDHSVETEAVTTKAGEWETLVFDFASQATGTQAINLDYTYNTSSIFFDFGNAGNGKTYYFDDLKFIKTEVTPPTTDTTAVVTFDDSAISYLLTGFGGADGTIVADTVDASNKVAKVVKAPGAETWAGTTFGQEEGGKSTITAVPFNATEQKMSVKVWSPDAGIKVRLKLEDKAAGNHSVETEAVTTKAGEWETLVFDFASQATGTEAIHLDYTYNMSSIFFDFNNVGTGKTYYFDDLKFMGSSTPTPTPIVLPVGNYASIPVGDPTILEAENANVKSGGVTVVDNVAAEGGSSVSAKGNMALDFYIDAVTAGTYKIDFRTNCGPNAGLDIALKVNGTVLKTVAAGAGSTWGTTTVSVNLKAGKQVLTVTGTTGVDSIILINNIVVTPPAVTVDISNTAPTVLEAERSANVTNGSIVLNDVTEGGSSLQSISAGNPMSFDYKLNVVTAGQYKITFRRKNTGVAGVNFQVLRGEVAIPRVDPEGFGPSATWTDTSIFVQLDAGIQVLTVFCAPGESSILTVNKVTIDPVK